MYTCYWSNIVKKVLDSESCSTISSAKANESFTVYLLLVKHCKIGTRHFANSWVEVLIADKIGQKSRQLLMISLLKIMSTYFSWLKSKLKTTSFFKIIFSNVVCHFVSFYLNNLFCWLIVRIILIRFLNNVFIFT